MKDMSYYSKIDVPYPDLFEIRRRMSDEINNKPMTAVERTKALRHLMTKARESVQPELDAYAAAVAAKTDEFWQDCRADLGYPALFRGCVTEKVAALEAYAWEKGHANGYNDVYCALSDVVELIRKLV